jgi:predicted lipoprotein with Yx(FWY)xxD motif/plastocyanin
VDDSGKTLYYFSKDAANPNACQEKCLENWPIYYADKLKVPAELDKSDFGVLVRADGTKQTTYKGWPLYDYIGDKNAGDTNGEAVNKVWFVVKGSSFAAIAQKEGLGSYLTDSGGRTLYYFDRDSKGVSACSGPCEANWPIFYQENIQAPTGTMQGDFGTLVRADGKMQTTYKGYPLYYYAKDLKRGDTTGQGVNDLWYVVDPAAFTATKAADFDVKLVSTQEGKVLADSKGRALYIFAKDEADLNSCKGQCLVNWPIFHSDSLKVSADLKAEDFGMFTRADGTMQITYRGWPLYYYIKDQYPGQILGQNVGKVWFLAGPDLTMALKKPDAAAPSLPADQAGKDRNIEISGFKFSVPELTVEAGAKVTFTNRDSIRHNAVAVDGSFRIPLLAKDESAAITLDKPGVYEYYCEPHKSSMTGKIIVK